MITEEMIKQKDELAHFLEWEATIPLSDIGAEDVACKLIFEKGYTLRKTATWSDPQNEYDDNTGYWHTSYTCSGCNKSSSSRYKYCPNCGAEMILVPLHPCEFYCGPYLDLGEA